MMSCPNCGHIRDVEPGLACPYCGAHLILLDEPRWPGGPPICPSANLPAFGSAKEIKDWIELNAPGVHTEAPEQCDACHHWHFKSEARGPAGESSGVSRFSKGS